MSAILLINPLVRQWAPANCFPTGLGLIAAVLKQAGHTVYILDLNVRRSAWSTLEGEVKHGIFNDVDAVGLSGIVTTYGYIQKLANLIKKHHPKLPIICGGPLATSSSKILLETTVVDIAVLGEGEKTIIALVDALERGASLDMVKGIAYLKHGVYTKTGAQDLISNLDTLPFPAYKLWGDLLNIYLDHPIGYLNTDKWGTGNNTSDGGLKSLNIVCTRSCPFQCRYCYSKYLGQTFRSRSNDNIIAELKMLRNTYEVDYIHFTDELSFPTAKKIREFCYALIDAGLHTDLMWGMPCRIDIVDEQTLKLMREANCKFIGFGIESGSPEILKNMNKKLDLDKARRNLALVQHYMAGMEVSFIIGFPGETPSTIAETKQFIQKTQIKPTLFYLCAYPGTKVYDDAVQQNIITDEVKYLNLLDQHEQGETMVLNLSNMPDNQLIQAKEELAQAASAVNIQKH